MIRFNHWVIMKISAGLFFLGAVIGMQYANTCLGRETEPVIPMISLTVNNEPLRSVLERISKISGYEFTLQGDLKDRQISMVIENIPLEEALCRLLWNLNHAIIWNQGKKKIIVFIIDERGSPGDRGVRDKSFSPIEIFRKTKRGLPREELHSIGRHTLDTKPERKRGRSGLKPSISGRDTDFVQGTRTTTD
jgi:hypothetical protein